MHGSASNTIVYANKLTKKYSLQCLHNRRNGVSSHQPHNCLLNLLLRRRSKKTSKLRVTGLCVGNSPVTGEFPAQMASNAENVSIWWRHLAKDLYYWLFVWAFHWLPGGYTHKGKYTGKCLHVVTSSCLVCQAPFAPTKVPPELNSWLIIGFLPANERRR